MIPFLPASAGEENATNRHTYDVFISYSSVDQPWVRDVLIKILEETGLKVCVDYRDFVPGAAIMENITRAITESKVTILVLTPNYVESKWCHYETRYAIGMSLSCCEGECGRRTNVLSGLVCVVLCLFICISQLVLACACLVSASFLVCVSSYVFGCVPVCSCGCGCGCGCDCGCGCVYFCVSYRTYVYLSAVSVCLCLNVCVCVICLFVCFSISMSISVSVFYRMTAYLLCLSCGSVLTSQCISLVH